MPHLKEKIAAITLLFSLTAFAKTELLAKLADGKAGVHARIPKPSAAVEALPSASEPVSIPSMTPEELPASAPKVTYSAGRLTIDAANTMLIDILNAIQTKTGAMIEIPREGSSERVAVHLSGPPSLVIPALLDGSAFGYVIRASPDDPEGVQEVVLTKKPLSGTSPTSGQIVMARSLAVSAPALVPNSAALGNEIPDIPMDRRPGVPEQTGSAQVVAQPIATTDGSDKSIEDKPDQQAQPLSAAILDPHPSPPSQIAANQQNADLVQQQRDTNRQFLQDLYSSRQKLQPPPPPQAQAQPDQQP